MPLDDRHLAFSFVRLGQDQESLTVDVVVKPPSCWMEFLRILDSDEITIIVIGKEDSNVIRDFELAPISMITSLISGLTPCW
jgi:hypothetical protein